MRLRSMIVAFSIGHAAGFNYIYNIIILTLVENSRIHKQQSSLFIISRRLQAALKYAILHFQLPNTGRDCSLRRWIELCTWQVCVTDKKGYEDDTPYHLNGIHGALKSVAEDWEARTVVRSQGRLGFKTRTEKRNVGIPTKACRPSANNFISPAHHLAHHYPQILSLSRNSTSMSMVQTLIPHLRPNSKHPSRLNMPAAFLSVLP